MSAGYVVMVIAAMGAVTFLIRALPFLAARWLRQSPVVRQVGVFLPPAIMTLLLIHSVRDLSNQSADHVLPTLVAVALVLALQAYKRQPLLSIAGGTVLYMLWLQLL
jgi:branched-subunit amino acid transport protein AzlD